MNDEPTNAWVFPASDLKFVGATVMKRSLWERLLCWLRLRRPVYEVSYQFEYRPAAGPQFLAAVDAGKPEE